MTTPTTTPFEDEVRAMLARRAGDIAAAGAAELPEVPTGLRIPIEGRPGGRSPRRSAWLVTAAALVLLAGLTGLVVASDDDGSTERTDTDGSSAAFPPRPSHLASLPGGVDPTVGPVLGVGPAAPTPEAAYTAALAPAFGDEVSPPAPFGWDEDDGVDPGLLWGSWYTPSGVVDPSVWTVDEATQADVGGSITARRTQAGWQAVAITSTAIDLTDVSYDGERLAGEVRVDAPAPMRVVLRTLGGEPLATVAGGTEAGDEPPDTTVTIGGHPLDGEPVLLEVSVGDRPGQVGVDGVGVAAYAAVVVTPGADPSSVPTTTTEAAAPVVPDETGTSPAPGAGALWRAPVERWGEDPGEAALAFAAEGLGADDITVDSAPVDAPRGAEVVVELELVSGVVVPVVLVREGNDWLVVRVDEGTVEVPRRGGGMGTRFGGAAATVATRSSRLTVVRPDGSWERYTDVHPADLRHAAGWIVTPLDATGRVVAATGNPA